jgi:hypothetical protein
MNEQKIPKFNGEKRKFYLIKASYLIKLQPCTKTRLMQSVEPEALDVKR